MYSKHMYVCTQYTNLYVGMYNTQTQKSTYVHRLHTYTIYMDNTCICYTLYTWIHKHVYTYVCICYTLYTWIHKHVYTYVCIRCALYTWIYTLVCTYVCICCALYTWIYTQVRTCNLTASPFISLQNCLQRIANKTCN